MEKWKSKLGKSVLNLLGDSYKSGFITLSDYFRDAKIDNIQERDSSKGFDDSGTQSNENETPPEIQKSSSFTMKNEENCDKITRKLSGKFKDQVDQGCKKPQSCIFKDSVALG